jgi:hypothetical protein
LMSDVIPCTTLRHRPSPRSSKLPRMNRPQLIHIQFTASMWTPEQSKTVHDTARSIIPDILTFSIPQGLQVNKGPDAVVDFIKENLPSLLEPEKK